MSIEDLEKEYNKINKDLELVTLVWASSSDGSIKEKRENARKLISKKLNEAGGKIIEAIEKKYNDPTTIQ